MSTPNPKEVIEALLKLQEAQIRAELKPGEEVGADEFLEWCRGQMAGFKRPKQVVFGELPKTSTGKIQKFVLRQKVTEAG